MWFFTPRVTAFRRLRQENHVGLKPAWAKVKSCQQKRKKKKLGTLIFLLNKSPCLETVRERGCVCVLAKGRINKLYFLTILTHVFKHRAILKRVRLIPALFKVSFWSLNISIK